MLLNRKFSTIVKIHMGVVTLHTKVAKRRKKHTEEEDKRELGLSSVRSVPWSNQVLLAVNPKMFGSSEPSTNINSNP